MALLLHHRSVELAIILPRLNIKVKVSALCIILAADLAGVTKVPALVLQSRWRDAFFCRSKHVRPFYIYSANTTQRIDVYRLVVHVEQWS